MFSALFYTSIRTLLRILARLMFSLDIALQAALPGEPAIYVANHPTATDPFMLHLFARMSILITAAAFAIPLARKLLSALHQIKATPGSESLAEAQKQLSKGRSIGIFPEGGNSPLGGGYKAPHSGAARLALSSGAKVVPVGIYVRPDMIRYTEKERKGTIFRGYFYLHGPFVMTVGEPMAFSGDPEDRTLVGQVTETIMERIKVLAKESRQRYEARRSAHFALPPILMRMLGQMDF